MHKGVKSFIIIIIMNGYISKHVAKEKLMIKTCLTEDRLTSSRCYKSAP